MLDIDGRATPAWLVVNGADATRRGRPRPGRLRRGGRDRRPRATALRQLAEGIAALGGGDARHVAVRRGAAVGAVPGELARLGLADAGRARRGRRRARRRACSARRSATRPAFDPWLLTSGGPDNGRLPTRIDRTQIAYGVDSRLQSLLATADVTGRPGLRRWPAIVGCLVLRRQRVRASRRTTRRPGAPSTASTANGDVNRNAGAESHHPRPALDARAGRAPGGGRGGPQVAGSRTGRQPRPAGRGRRTRRRRAAGRAAVGVDRGVALRWHRLRGAR